MKESFYWSRIDQFGRASFEAVADTILACPFVSHASQGFLVEKRSGEEVAGSYVERRIVTDRVRDPLGEVVVTERVAFDYLPFRVQAAEPHFEFVGAPRLHARFFRCLNNAFSQYFVESRIHFNVEHFVEQLTKRFATVEVSILRVDGLLINSRTLCGIEFRSSIDVRDDAKTLLKESRVQVSYANVKAKASENQAFELEIWRSGKLMTALKQDSPAFDVVREIVASQRDHSL